MADLRGRIARAIYTSQEFAAAAAFGVPIDAKTVCAEGIADAVIAALGMREEWMVHWPIASAPEHLDQMERALRAVMERHRPIEVEPSDTICAACSNQLPNGRFLPVVEWPCPDVDVILEVLGDE